MMLKKLVEIRISEKYEEWLYKRSILLIANYKVLIKYQLEFFKREIIRRNYRFVADLLNYRSFFLFFVLFGRFGLRLRNITSRSHVC